MKYLLAFVALAVVFMCYTEIEATSEPICFYEELKKPVPRWHDFIHFKDPSETTGCLRKVSCNKEYKTVIEECSPGLCIADKALDKTVFPDCCCF